LERDLGVVGMPIEGVTAVEHGPGSLPDSWRIGDYLLVSAGVWKDGKRGPVPMLSRLIQWAQARRFPGDRRPYAHWNHAVWVSSDGLIEATREGVVKSPFEKYRDVEFALVHSNLTEAERTDADQFVRYLLDAPTCYGKATLFSIAFSLLLGIRVIFGVRGTVICSGLVAAALSAEHWRADPSHIMPADLAEYARITMADVHIPAEETETPSTSASVA
jgi:hypothetical protein